MGNLYIGGVKVAGSPDLELMTSGNVAITNSTSFASQANIDPLVIDETAVLVGFDFDENSVPPHALGGVFHLFRLANLLGREEGDYGASLVSNFINFNYIRLGWKQVGGVKHFMVSTSDPNTDPMPIRFYKVF